MAKVIKTETLTREFSLRDAAINEAARTVELSFSSEAPVERWFGIEILDHSRESVDLSWLSDGGPLLVGHDTSDVVGVVERASVGDKRGRATVRFGTSSRAEEIFTDVKNKIRKSISVGYRVMDMEEESVKDNVPTMRVTKWKPMEISIVAVPADESVGVGIRNVDQRVFETTIHQKDKDMSEPIIATPLNPPPAPTPTPGLEARQLPDHLLSDDVKQIRATVEYYKAKVPGIEALGQIAEISGRGFEWFRGEAVKLIQQPEPVKQPTPLDIKPKDLERHYSLSRAIASMLPGGKGLSGMERELSVEISKKFRQEAEGFWVPREVLVGNMERSYVAGTGTLGGMIVQTSNLGQEFIEILRNKAQVMALGARTLMLDTPVTIPRRGGSGGANWVGETVASTLSVGNFEQITLTPKGISANQQYAKQLLVTNNPSIDALIRDDIMSIIGLAIDLAALHGTGTTQPTGIIGTTGIGSVALATNAQALGNSTAYAAMVSLETLVSTANADLGALAYLARSAHRGSLKIAQRFSSTDSPVWTTAQTPGNQPGNGGSGGMVNGYRAEVTNQIATNLTTGTATTICSSIFFGNWSELLIAQFNGGATDLVVDPYTAGANAVVRLYARHWIDIGVRHGASFAVLGGIL